MGSGSRLILPLMLGMFSGHGEGRASIPSHKIEQKKEEVQLSKRKIQKIKGKKTRKNRGKNRRKKR